MNILIPDALEAPWDKSLRHAGKTIEQLLDGWTKFLLEDVLLFFYYS